MKRNFIYTLSVTLFLFISTFSFTFAVTPETIKVAAFDNFPLIFRDTDGIYKGLYVDLLTEIGKKENINFQYVFGTWSDGLNAIKSGTVDLVTSVGYTQDRSLYMDYTADPILTVWGELYALPESNISSILDVSNKKIGLLEGDVNAINFKDLLSQFHLDSSFLYFPTYADMFSAVASKKIDAGVAGITFGVANEAKYGLESTGVVFNPIGLYFATAKGKNQELLKILDKYFLDWRNQDNSFFKQAERKWLYGSVDTVTITPTWVNNIFLFLLALIIIAIIFIIALRIQVNKATNKILQREKSLQESENKYHSIFDNFNDLYYQLDMRGIITNLSPSSFTISGWKPEELIGHNVLELYPKPEQRKALLDKLGKEGKVMNYEINLLHKDGRILTAAISSSLIKDKDGNPIRIEGTIRDVTEDKKLEEKLKANNEELLKINKLMVGRELKMAELKKEAELFKAQSKK